jgi:glycosyltransferase involved in cell wall biosynthesis
VSSPGLQYNEGRFLGIFLVFSDPHGKRLSSLSIFFPCYNDAGTIGSLVLLAFRVAEWLTDDYEVIVIDDMSTDNSRAILEGLQPRYPRLKVVYHESNKGYGGALKTGIAAAGKEFVFYTDGDGQYDVLELVRLAERMNDGVDVVNGYKVNRADAWFRRLVGFIYNKTVRFAFGIKMRDIDCDFRLMRRTIFERVSLESDTGVICTEMMKKIQDQGYTVVDVPVHHFHRLYGASQFFTGTHLARSLWALAKYWRKIRRSNKLAKG